MHSTWISAEPIKRDRWRNLTFNGFFFKTVQVKKKARKKLNFLNNVIKVSANNFEGTKILLSNNQKNFSSWRFVSFSKQKDLLF